MTLQEIVSRAGAVGSEIPAYGKPLRLEYAGVSIDYCSDEAASAAWITQFFEGYLVPSSDAKQADITVSSTRDPMLFASLRELAPEQPAATEHDYVEIPLTGSVTLIRREAGKVRPRENVFLLLFEKDRKIVLVTSGNPEVRREEGMQCVRSAIKWLLLERGWLPMHSACAVKNGRSICVSGPKASGKTSTLLNLLARNGCDLLAVDKFLIRDGGDCVEVTGIPGKIGIRVGSAIAQPHVLDWIAGAVDPFFPHISAEEVQHIAATNIPEQLRNRPEKINLTPAELAALFGRSITHAAPLGLLLIPVFDLDVEDSQLAPVAPAQAIVMLANCYVSLLEKGEGFLLRFFDLSDAVLEERLAALLTKHLPGMAAFQVRQNHRTNARTAELVAGLLQSVH